MVVKAFNLKSPNLYQEHVPDSRDELAKQKVPVPHRAHVKLAVIYGEPRRPQQMEVCLKNNALLYSCMESSHTLHPD